MHDYVFSGTLLDEDERQYLQPEYQHLTTRAEVHAAEGRNIIVGRAWLRDQDDLTVETFLKQGLLRTLHKEMYARVWTWGGAPQQRENNIGDDPDHSYDKWEQLLGNTQFFLASQTYPVDECCIRLFFGQRQIQPFVDGNSRHARLTIMRLAELVGIAEPLRPRFPWGRAPDAIPDEVRSEYLAAYAKCHDGDYGPLTEMARRG